MNEKILKNFSDCRALLTCYEFIYLASINALSYGCSVVKALKFTDKPIFNREHVHSLCAKVFGSH